MLARTFALTAAAAVLLGGAAARAQPAQPAQPAPAPGPAPDEATVPDDVQFPEVITPPPGFERDRAWSLYDSAFRDAAAGDLSLARERLERLASRWPAHPARSRADALLERTGPRRRDPDGASNVARGELVFWSTLGGVSLAAHLCVAFDCTSDRAYAAAYTFSVGGALAGSILASRRGIRQGEAQLYNSAQTWGAWNALLINDGFPETAEQAGVAIAMQLGGLAAGVGLWQAWRPTQGDVALTNTFLLWSTVMTLWGHIIAEEEPAIETVVIAGDVALLLGALVSREVKMSRGRTLLIDVGGILGTLTGALLGAGADDASILGITLMIGTGAGLGLAAVGTKSWDKAPSVKVAPAVIPGPARSAGYGFSAGFSF
ncbi:MAG TPA: hypothetical protein VK932_18855 [Kofleriaceae bacterium]|nr:hypothetical protein [Kofleriaceae bacterium]